MIVRHVGVWSVARILGVLYGCIGLIVGLCVALLSTAGFGIAAAQGGPDAPPAFVGALFGVGAIVILPILYGLMGLVGGAIMAALYNLFAGMVGGVEVDFDGAKPAGV